MIEGKIRRKYEAAGPLGGDKPNLSEYGSWRRKAGARILESLDRYSRYCAGQFSGMGEALSMHAVEFACRADGIPRRRWAEATEDLVLIHSVVLKRMERPKADGR
jgi:hypothetical protein